MAADLAAFAGRRSGVCEKRAEREPSTATVRYRANDYSVPMAYGFQAVLVKGFVNEVVTLTYSHGCVSTEPHDVMVWTTSA